jgi:very-short-patch-repair endonuclease
LAIKTLTKKNEVKYLFSEKPTFLKHWDYDNNTIDPLLVTSGSKRQVYLVCENGHKFSRLPVRLFRSNNIYCAECNGQKVTDYNRLDLSHPNILGEWDYKKNKDIKPCDVAFNSNKKVFWICENNHSWEQGVSSRTGTRYKNRVETRCPTCYQSSKSRNELILYAELHQFFTSVHSTFKSYKKELDIYIEDLNLGIEYDGEYWHKTKVNLDLEKNKVFKDNGIDVLRIREDKLSLLSDIDYPYRTKDDIFLAIIWILNHIIDNYNLDIKTESKIKSYISGNKTTNLEFFETIVDANKIKKITNKTLFTQYSNKNKTALHYFGAGSDVRATWDCHDCGHEWKVAIKKRCGGSRCPKCRNISLVQG